MAALTAERPIAPDFIVSGDDDATDARETPQTAPYVRIVFAGEAAEYAGDTNKMVTLTSLTMHGNDGRRDRKGQTRP